ncbi:7933_t:CDS:2, partial [Paraglomus occultum]
MAAAISDKNAFQRALRSARHIVVLAGAGLSAALPDSHQLYPLPSPFLYLTFFVMAHFSNASPKLYVSSPPYYSRRVGGAGEGGLWRTHDAMSLATPRAFRANPSRVWQFYHYRRELVLTREPNRAHKALVAFEQKILSQANSQSSDTPAQTFALITQNIDGLSAGVQNLIEMHGMLFKNRCTICGDVRENRDSPIVPALAGTENEEAEREIALEDLPKCGECGGLLRPHVVWFEESLETSVLARIQQELLRCDLLMIVGTSGLVYPAAGFRHAVKMRNPQTVVANFNIVPMERVDESLETGIDFEFIGPCGQTLPEALDVEEEVNR